MVGQGVLRECLLSPEVDRVRAVGRTAVAATHAKLRQTVRPDLFDYSGVETELTGFDACFFCLGLLSSGMKEEDYTRLTFDLTMAVAEFLLKHNPDMVFVYVSGAGTDGSENGRIMWARVKGRTENALLRLPFKAAYMFRPGLIQPLHGIQSKTRIYRLFYTVTKPVLPMLRALLPAFILTTEQVGRAMIAVTKRGSPKRILESRDIYELVRHN